MFLGVLAGAAAVALPVWLVWNIGVRSQEPKKRPNTELPAVPYKEVTFQSCGSSMKGWLLRPVAAGNGEADGSAVANAGTDAGLDAHPDPVVEARSAGSEPADQRLPLVIVAHGWSSNRSRVLRYVDPLLSEGYAVFLYDARCHGDSDSIKAASALLFREDIEAAVDAISAEPGIDRDRIAVLGHSLGGFGALLALPRGLPVKAVVTDSTPSRFNTMVRAEFKRRKLPYFPLAVILPPIWLWRAEITWSEYKTARVAAALQANEAGRKVPVLMVHCKGDDFIPADDLRELVQSCKVDALFVEGNGHSESEQDPEFWRRVLPFLRENLQ